VVALRLAPEPSLNKPPTEAQYAPEALQLQDPATLTHAQETAAPDPATAKTRTSGDIVRISSVMLAPTIGSRTGLFPTARSCVDVAAAMIASGVHGVGEHAL